MAKSVEAARARRRKEAAKAAAREKALLQKSLKPALIVLAAAVLIAAGVFAYNALHLDPHQVAVRGGALQSVQDDWLVYNMGTDSKPKCLHLGSLPQPAGYTLEPAYNVSSVEYCQTLYYKADAEDEPVRTVYATGADGTVSAMMDMLQKRGNFFTELREPVDATIAGYDVKYTYAVSAAQEDGRSVITMYCYTGALSQYSIGVCLVSETFADGDDVRAEELRGLMLTRLESVLGLLKVNQ